MTAYFTYEEFEEENEHTFTMFRNLGITAEDMHLMLSERGLKFEKRDLLPYTFPTLKEMNNVKINPIYLGNYIIGIIKKYVEIIREELDWQGDELEGVPQEANKSFSKIECFMQGSRDYIKYLKEAILELVRICR